MELVIDSTIMKRRPLFLAFSTLFPAITTCVVVLILAVNYSTERFYETIIQQGNLRIEPQTFLIG